MMNWRVNERIPVSIDMMDLLNRSSVYYNALTAQCLISGLQKSFVKWPFSLATTRMNENSAFKPVDIHCDRNPYGTRIIRTGSTSWFTIALDLIRCSHPPITQENPNQEKATGYGTRFTAFVGKLSAIKAMNRNDVKQLVESVLQIPISTGAIQKLVERNPDTILQVYEQIGRSFLTSGAITSTRHPGSGKTTSIFPGFSQHPPPKSGGC